MSQPEIVSEFSGEQGAGAGGARLEAEPLEHLVGRTDGGGDHRNAAFLFDDGQTGGSLIALAGARAYDGEQRQTWHDPFQSIAIQQLGQRST